MNFWFKLATIQLAFVCAVFVLFKINDWIESRQRRVKTYD